MNRFITATAALVAIEAALTAGIITAGVAHAGRNLPFCTYEDGNENGRPCMWSDPDTGTLYYVDSANYRRCPAVVVGEHLYAPDCEATR